MGLSKPYLWLHFVVQHIKSVMPLSSGSLGSQFICSRRHRRKHHAPLAAATSTTALTSHLFAACSHAISDVKWLSYIPWLNQLFVIRIQVVHIKHVSNQLNLTANMPAFCHSRRKQNRLAGLCERNKIWQRVFLVKIHVIWLGKLRTRLAPYNSP